VIELNINKDLIKIAENRANSVNVLSKKLSKYGSEKKRIFEGYLGEEIIKDFLKINKTQDKYNYDFISNKGKKLEVKTVSCSFKPLENYLCTVNSHSEKYTHKQKADYYIFLRIIKDYSKCWILGWIECDLFFKKGKFIQKGTDFNKFKFTKANATVLEIKELNKF